MNEIVSREKTFSLFQQEQAKNHTVFACIWCSSVTLVTHYSPVSITSLSWIEYIILFASTFRLIFLWSYDDITSFLRAYLKQFEGNDVRRTLANAISCPWCSGMWSALLVTALYMLFPISRLFLFILSLAGVGTLVHKLLDKIPG